jgi:hypothetical protein
MSDTKQRDRANMDADQLWEEYSALSFEAQQQLIAFLAHLRAKQTAQAQPGAQHGIDLSEEPAIGMWRDHDDMADGAPWIRDLRDREWSRHRR